MDRVRPLEGKVTVVTGAGGGIGRAICSHFASLGSRVYLCDIGDTADLAAEINHAEGGEYALPAVCDIADPGAVGEMFARIDRDGGADILVNNAAVQGPKGPKRFPAITPEGFRSTLDIDLSGAFYCIRHALPAMREKGWGRMLFTAAPLSSSGIPSPYLAGKAGFIGMARQIAGACDDEGIRTFALALRHVDTPMIRRVIESRGGNVEEGIAGMHAKSLTGSMITPGEIARLYGHFAAAPTRAVRSVSLLADGGITYLR
ncbi:MAG: SDR family oxidoreductase [Synergistales bacterium]|nr:SDR family oxidoreductase [Synergistales bacterium]